MQSHETYSGRLADTLYVHAEDVGVKKGKKLKQMYCDLASRSTAIRIGGPKLGRPYLCVHGKQQRIFIREQTKAYPQYSHNQSLDEQQLPVW